MSDSHYLLGQDYLTQKKYPKAIEALGVAVWKGEVGGRVTETEIAKRDLAIAYFNLGDYESAFEKYIEIIKSDDLVVREYAISMISVINATWGNYKDAVAILEELPSCTRNLINKAWLFYHLHKYDHIPGVLGKAEETLKQIDLNATGMNTDRLQKIYNAYAVIYQEKKDFEQAEQYYLLALQNVQTDLEKGRLLNDYGSYFIAKRQLERAEEILEKARELLEGRDLLGEGRNAKWRGCLEKEKKNFEKARNLLIKAANILKEKGLYKELAEVCILLSDKYLETDVTICAEFLAESRKFEDKYREVSYVNEEVIRLLNGYLVNDRCLRTDCKC